MHALPAAAPRLARPALARLPLLDHLAERDAAHGARLRPAALDLRLGGALAHEGPGEIAGLAEGEPRAIVVFQVARLVAFGADARRGQEARAAIAPDAIGVRRFLRHGLAPGRKVDANEGGRQATMFFGGNGIVASGGRQICRQ